MLINYAQQGYNSVRMLVPLNLFELNVVVFANGSGVIAMRRDERSFSHCCSYQAETNWMEHERRDITVMHRFLGDAFARMHNNLIFDGALWSTRYENHIVVPQLNPLDVAVGRCVNAKLICSGLPLCYNNENIHLLRKRMALELNQGYMH